MFARLGRIFQSFLNKFISSAEDPILILENNLRELQALIPQLNQSVATSQAAVIQIQKQLGKYQEEERELDSKIKAALQLNEEEAAKDFVMKLQDVQIKVAKLSKDLELAMQNAGNVQQMRDLRYREIKQKQDEIRGKVSDYKFSQIQSQIAESLDSSVAKSNNDLSTVIDDNMQKLDQQTAMNQATLAASLQNSKIDITSNRIEQKAKEMNANLALDKYKEQMGLPTDSKSATSGNVVDAEAN